MVELLLGKKPRSHWQILSGAPHRLFFLAGGLQLIAAIGLWLAVLLGRIGIAPAVSLMVPPTWAHAFLALYGIFPFFVFGFLLTVFPRWLHQQAVPRLHYVWIFLPLAAGMVIYYVGLLAGISAVMVIGVGIFALGWLFGALTLHRVYRAATIDRYARMLLIALVAGLAGVVAYSVAVVGGHELAYRLSRLLGLWLFLCLTLFTVSHRMIPFFGQSALANYPLVRPAWSLPVAAIGLAGHAVLELAGLVEFLLLVDLPLALIALQHTIAWNFRRSFEVKLLAMLHIAFAWFGVAMALYTVRGVALLAGADWISANAPLHALTVGFIAGMAVAMVSRVTLGHAGRRLWADHLTWYSFLGISTAALLRLLAEFSDRAYDVLNTAAAVVWIVCLLGWAGHYLPIYLAPRIDGRPG